MSSVPRLFIMPDKANSVGVGVLGCIFLIVTIGLAIFYDMATNVFVIFFGALGVVCVMYSLASLRGPSSLPRIEIDKNGIRDLALFHSKSIDWSAITGLEPYVQQAGDTDNHYVRIWHSQAPVGLSTEATHYDLWLNCFLPEGCRSLGSTTEIAEWLRGFQTSAMCGTYAAEANRTPQCLRCILT